MGLFQEGNFELSPHDCPLSKRRRFTPQSLLPIIPVSDNSDIENHTFDSPLILQLCEQAPLPEQIQADLLKVGMRVRKAVPEGYKTHRFTPRPFFNMNRLSPETQAAVSGSPKQSNVDLSSFSAGGLHNVGGLAMQPLSTATFCGISLSTLAKFESSYNDQPMWSYSTSHKRGIELDEESDEQDWSPHTPTLAPDNAFGFPMPMDYFNIDMENMVDVSPMTQIHHKRQNSIPFQHTRQPELNAMSGRRVANPKPRLRRNVQEMPAAPAVFNPFADLGMIQEQPPTSPAVSHHRRMMSCGMEANLAMNDFADASFLQRREDVEMDCS